MSDYYDGPVPDPFEPPHYGADLLDEVEAMLSRFVAFPSEETRVATVLWIAHAHSVDAFETTPRLAFLSPEPGSGKTRALEIVEMLVPNPVLTVNATPAYLIRRLADENRPTLLFDEIDTVFGPKAKSDNEEVRGLINSGYRRGATSGRCVIKGKSVEVEDFPSFAAVALAGLDDLPDTIATRAVLVRMRRRAPHERVQPYRRRVHETPGHELRDRLASWVHSRYSELEGAWPELPAGIEDRDADVWEPLIAIADAAGREWPDRARVSAVSLVSLSRQERGGLGIRLLADIRRVFEGAEHMGTDELLDALHRLDEAPWDDLKGKPLDARGLAFRLGKYGIGPRQLKAINRKGYRRDDLADAWSRYLPVVSHDLGGGVTQDTPWGITHPEDVASLPQWGRETPETSETRPFPLVSGPGRCPGCGFHVATQGHRAGCEAAA
ncbi:DUF3631 domain-containing protein [Terrabacter lapilli]|uniref:DUF3631 domain-containing protein n=1 Tax=Terrabacter lapilli TaxID=436231 RepID=A0ABN2RHR6_9MICO